MDLSVVVLSWNTSALTARALVSAREGVGDLDAEFLCVDNASDDDSRARVGREAPWARWIQNEANLGFAAGNNRALGHVKGRVTCFLNSDAAPAPGALAHVARWMEAHRDVAIAAPRLVSDDGARQRAARPDPSALGLLHRYTALGFTPIGRRGAKAFTAVDTDPVPHPVASVTGACLLIRTDVLRMLEGFDEGYPFYWEDVDLCRRARALGFGVALVPDGPPVRHVGGAATRVAGGPPRMHFFTGLARYARRRFGRRGGGLFVGLLVPGVFARALVEAPRLEVQALRRSLQGREAKARESRRSARAWRRLLERDAGALLRLLRTPRCLGRGPA